MYKYFQKARDKNGQLIMFRVGPIAGIRFLKVRGGDGKWNLGLYVWGLKYPLYWRRNSLSKIAPASCR